MSKYPRAFGVWAKFGWRTPMQMDRATCEVVMMEGDQIVEFIPLPEIERLIRETCEAWRERDSAMSVEIENELIDAIRKGGES